MHFSYLLKKIQSYSCRSMCVGLCRGIGLMMVKAKAGSLN